ncbi:MAG: diacylglycerol kinase family protein [Chloroflexota bacterium]|nr:diacylglycerol kinase family protein [Chloroflexota bacterium]
MSYRTLLIHNPAAGPWNKSRWLEQLAVNLQKHGWATDVVATQQTGDATRLARQARDMGYELVLVAGGDGTINEVTNGLVGAETALGIVPVGTGNILAHQMRMPILGVASPFSVTEVENALVHSYYQWVDVGQVGERYFVCWAGIGFDAEITSQMEPRSKYIKFLGIWPYALKGVAIAPEFRGVRTRVTVGNRTFNTRTVLIVVSNIQHYAAFNMARHAYMDDGMLDIFIFKGLGLSYILRHLVHILSGRHVQDPSVIQILARQLRLETTPEVIVQLDGEPCLETPVTISLVPRALRLLVPPQAPRDLFSHPPEEL